MINQTASDLLSVVPQHLLKKLVMFPPNESLFFSGGVHYSNESGRVHSRSLEDARLLEQELGKKFVVLDDMPGIKQLLSLKASVQCDDIVLPEKRIERTSYKSGAIVSALFALGTNGTRFNVSLNNPHPLSLFRSIELPILMTQCKNLTEVNVISRDADGIFHQTVKDKSQWFDESRDEWLNNSIKEYELARKLYSSDQLPYAIYASSVKRIEAEINESLWYMKQNKGSYGNHIREEQRLSKAVQIAKEIPELNNLVLHAQCGIAGRA
jgi:hypothetical protein